MFRKSLSTALLILSFAAPAFAQTSDGAAGTTQASGAGAPDSTIVVPEQPTTTRAATTAGATAGNIGTNAAMSNCGADISMHGTGTAGSVGAADAGTAGTGASATTDTC
ncbi:hypothetical protein [Rhizobium halophilum]|uniref:hypothetical protein n=1 Tax=Rhizobium halophilum TaxID=2846852 RepID=UPI001EFE6BC8|nr:hypothetical protein [Rhizobium halophilum]MCF6368566.1 hypothetical protein [Rhizobium halophilum]